LNASKPEDFADNGLSNYIDNLYQGKPRRTL